jgi:hypothetical protein
MLSLNFAQAVTAIAAVGTTNTLLLRGAPGMGKSAILHALARQFPEHIPSYIDCANLDLGDIAMPVIDREAMVTHYAPNARFNVRRDSSRPVIIMLDELTKAPRAVQNMLLPLGLERRLGDIPLPSGSIVFATGNLDSDGVNDSLQAHAANRMTVVDYRNPTAEEWIQWGGANEVHASVLLFAYETPQIFDRYDSLSNAKENPYVFNPLTGNIRAFTSGRSLEKASHLIHQRDVLGDALLPLLAGTIGEPAARMLEASIAIEDKVPRRDVILANPDKAPLPTDISAHYLLAIRCASQASQKTLEGFVTYVERWKHMEAKTLFATMIAGNKDKIVWALKTTNFRNLAATCGKFF